LLPDPVPAFATHDDSLEAVARAAAEHAGRILCPFPEWPRLEEVQQKRWQLAQAAEAGVPAPHTAHPVTAEEARAFADEVGYPVLFKPSDPIGFRKAYKLQGIQCHTAADIDEAFAKMEPYEPMLQEMIPGGDEELYTLGSVISQRNLAPLGLFCGRKLLQTPPMVGSCRLGEALWQPEVVEQGVRLQQHARVNGVSQVEFKRDPRDGQFKLMEINPRLWQWHTLARACGVNLPLIAYSDLLGDEVTPVTTEGKRRKWAVAILGGEKAVVPRPPFTEGVLSLRDPKPSAVHLVSVFRRWRKGRKRQP
jgi:D-aspartate ligase